MTKERIGFSPDHWDRTIAPMMARIDTRVGNLLRAPIWSHDGGLQDNSRERWFQHGKDEAAISALYYIHYPNDLPKDVKLEDILFGYAVHDIGKSEVSPDPTIWHRKRTDLTAPELAALQNHVTTAVTLLKRYEYISGETLPNVMYEIVTRHHEKLDGTGNPNHLIGDMLSPVVRLAAVIDQVVSRCEPRSYHDRSFTLKEAMEEVAKGSGTAYDPEVITKVRNLFMNDVHLQIPTLTWLGSWK